MFKTSIRPARTLFCLYFFTLTIACSRVTTITKGPRGENSSISGNWTANLSSFDKSVWTPEITASGGGNFEFEIYTDQNVSVSNNILYLKPGMTRDYQLTAGQAWYESSTFSSPPINAGLGSSVAGSHTSGGLSDPLVLGCGDTSASSASAPRAGCSTFAWLDLGAQCTSTGAEFGLAYNACYVSSGYSITNNYINIMNPVTSARISTKNSKSFLYGRLEVKAKIPKGDWLWPAIWLLPVPYGNPYGNWPMSGEIDMVESRGNARACSDSFVNAQTSPVAFGGVQSFASTLHWGPTEQLNSFNRTHTEYSVPLAANTLDTAFHTYGLRWNTSGLYTYIDNDQNHILEVSFLDQSFESRGQSSLSHCLKKGGGTTTGFSCVTNEAVPNATWPTSSVWPTKQGPFDQPFYLILNLAIGGLAGEGATAYFPEGSPTYCGKPWVNKNTDGSGNWTSYPVAAFYAASSNWFSTWSDDGIKVSDNAALQVSGINYWVESDAGNFGPLTTSAN